MTSATARPPIVRPGLLKAFVAISAVIVVLMLVQAVLAGQALYGTADILVHGYLGNATFTLGFAATLLAPFARLPRWLSGLAAALLVVLFVQTGIGYVGRTSLEARAWHIPLGVVAFGLAAQQLTGALQLARRPASA